MEDTSIISNYIDSLISLTSGRQKDYFNWVKREGSFYNLEDKFQVESSVYYEEAKKLVKPKNCFNNSILMSIRYEELDYIEGFYELGICGMPFDHGFNSLNGLGYDFTSYVFGFEPRELFGIKIPKPIIEEYINSDLSGGIPLLLFYYKKLNYMK